MTDYLTIIEVLAIHHDQIKRYGGADGVRDFGLLEAALYRPQTGYYEDVIEEAAALWESLAMNHPFVDGNKRVAAAAMITFLAINGYSIRQEAQMLYRFIIENLEGRSFRHDRLAAWLRANTVGVDHQTGDKGR
ncbi:MAG: type II toxin-antitoxin system death-on-curing family toxin [Roseomonas sp.]|nr:type II toxin-antitoxin system death-on-curing family toxin [Roseomonas sp.]MCA3427279.1 type II toxin-antitoxin system death-on-curing family toxin [Roseomonas sp.]